MDMTLVSACVKLIGDGLFIFLIAILYINDRKKRQKEYEEERNLIQEDYKKIKKAREEEYKCLNNDYNKMVKDIISGITGHHLTAKESKSIAQVEKQVNDIIRNMLTITNASRVCIVKYHNGNKDMAGISFLKMSMTNEAVNVGVAPLMPDFQGHFRSLLAYWCHELDTTGKCIIPDTEDLINVDITMYEYLKTRNIEAKYGVTLRDLKGNPIGFICVEYLNKNDFNKEKIDEIIEVNQLKLEALVGLKGV